jgi:hypothetical protein
MAWYLGTAKGGNMSLDVYLEMTRPTQVYSANITHNLSEMAKAAGIYKALWRPEKIGITKANQLIPLLEKGLKKLKRSPAKFKAFNASNDWGVYENFVPFVERYIDACKEYPDADISVSR